MQLRLPSRLVAALGMLLGAVTFATAQVPNWPQTLPASTVVGRLAIGPGPAQAIPFAQLLTNWTGVQNPNVIYAGPTTGSTAFPTFRSLVTADFPANVVANSALAQMGGNTVKGNGTGSTANATDMAMPSCSGSGDALIWTTSTGFGCANTLVNTFNGRSGPAVTPAAGDYTVAQLYGCTIKPQGRLTLSTGVPVMTSTVSSAATVYYTPYVGTFVPIYDGTRFICTDTGGELSQATTDTTKSPAAVTTNACYDIFVWNDSGTIRATRGPLWTNVTTRSAGTALARINGILTNNVAITNGPAQNKGTYVGSICSDGSSVIDFIYGTPSSGGTGGNFSVWNQYNRVVVTTTVVDNGTSYNYASATVRQARGSNGNQVTYISGNLEDGATVSLGVTFTSPSTGSSSCQAGYGLDATNAFAAVPVQAMTVNTTPLTFGLNGTWTVAPQIGRHVLSSNEASPNTGTCVNDVLSLNQLSFSFRM